MANDQRFEQLKQKYQSVISAMGQHQVRLQNVNMEGDKLLIRGEAPSEEAKNRVWDQIKLVDTTYSDLTADISVNETAAPRTMGAGVGGGERVVRRQHGRRVRAGEVERADVVGDHVAVVVAHGNRETERRAAGHTGRDATDANAERCVVAGKA